MSWLGTIPYVACSFKVSEIIIAKLRQYNQKYLHSYITIHGFVISVNQSFKHLCKLLLMQGSPLVQCTTMVQFHKATKLEGIYSTLTAAESIEWVPRVFHWVEKQTLEVKLKHPKTNMPRVYSPCEQKTLQMSCLWFSSLSAKAKQKANWVTKCPAITWYITQSSYIMRSLIKKINTLFNIFCMSVSMTYSWC